MFAPAALPPHISRKLEVHAHKVKVEEADLHVSRQHAAVSRVPCCVLRQAPLLAPERST